MIKGHSLARFDVYRTRFKKFSRGRNCEIRRIYNLHALSALSRYLLLFFPQILGIICDISSLRDFIHSKKEEGDFLRPPFFSRIIYSRCLFHSWNRNSPGIPKFWYPMHNPSFPCSIIFRSFASILLLLRNNRFSSKLNAREKGLKRIESRVGIGEKRSVIESWGSPGATSLRDYLWYRFCGSEGGKGSGDAENEEANRIDFHRSERKVRRIGFQAENFQGAFAILEFYWKYWFGKFRNLYNRRRR